MSKHTRFELPENLRTPPGHLFINSSAARRGYSRAAAMLNQWRREEQRGKDEQLSQPG